MDTLLLLLVLPKEPGQAGGDITATSTPGPTIFYNTFLKLRKKFLTPKFYMYIFSVQRYLYCTRCLFFVDINFDMPYDERWDENCGDVVTDVHENLESPAVGDGEITLNINDDLEQ